MIKGQATEVIDVGHFLPMAFADWFSRKEMRPSLDRAVGAAGRRLARSSATCWRRCSRPPATRCGWRRNAQEGLAALRSGQTFDVVLTDIEMPDMNGFEFAETHPRRPAI